jgi:hypothetical protein
MQRYNFILQIARFLLYKLRAFHFTNYEHFILQIMSISFYKLQAFHFTNCKYYYVYYHLFINL